MFNFLALLLCTLTCIMLVNAVDNCNERILLKEPRDISTSPGIRIEEIANGTNASLPLINSNKVFVLTIAQQSDYEVAFNLDQEYFITGIGIRQRFDKSEVGHLCPSSFHHDSWDFYNIVYRNSMNPNNASLDYPPGTEIGTIFVNTLLPYQKVLEKEVKKKSFKVAIAPIKVSTISITKERLESEDGTYVPRTFCLQYELYGCEISTEISHSASGILEYQMELPDLISWDGANEIEHSDSGYTGICTEGSCTGGIGKLVDGQKAGYNSYNPELFVVWNLNGTDEEVFYASNVTIRTMKILIILDDIYFTNKIEILGTTKIGDVKFTVPWSITVNGVFIATNTVYGTKDFYSIILTPRTTTSNLLLDFYVILDGNRPWIAISEITIEKDRDPIEELKQDNDSTAPLIVVSIMAGIFLILMTTSLAANIYFIITKCYQKRNDKNSPPSPTRHQSCYNSYTRHYSASTQFQAIPESNYETIDFDTTPPITDSDEVIVEIQPTSENLPFQEPQSIIYMPSNPTYVPSIPNPNVEKDEGYSKLDFTKPNKQSSNEDEDLPSPFNSDEVAEMRPIGERMNTLTAKGRRTSFGEMKGLSDLK